MGPVTVQNRLFYIVLKLILFVTRKWLFWIEVTSDSFIANAPELERHENYEWAFTTQNLIVNEGKMDSKNRRVLQPLMTE